MIAETDYTYSTKNQLTEVTSGDTSVSYQYTNSDPSLLTKIITPTGTSYSFNYDIFGRTTKTYVGTRALSTNTYTGNLLTKQTYGNGKYVDFVYDNLDRLFQKKYNGVTKLEYAYNASGDLASMIDYFADKQQFYTYDLSGRLVEAYTKDLSTNSLYTHTVFDYIDAKNLLGGKTVYLYGGSTVPQYTLAETYTYGNQAAGEIPEALYGISLNGEEILSYAYDSLGRLVTKTLDKAGINTTYTYKDIGTDGKTTTLVSEYTTNGKNFLYTYDSLGNITEVRVASVEADMYEYDELSRLVRVNSDPGAYNDGVQTGLPESKTVAYEYDDSGNILSKKTYGWTLAEDLTTLTPTETITYTYGDSQWKDLLTNYNGTAITYDTIGNPANWRDGMTFTWANGRQLQSVTSGTNTYSFEYNADGIRTHKNNPDTTQSLEYVIDESGRIAGLKRHNVWVATYVYDENDSPIGMRLGTTEYWFVKNLQGDIIEVVNNAGTVLANYYYDEWGVPTAVYKGIVGERLVGKNNIFLYRGYVYDWETGLYYLNSRYYDPVVGRFINADGFVSTGQGLDGHNMFAYCNNNPVNRNDPLGTSYEDMSIFTLEILIAGMKADVVTNQGNPYSARCSSKHIFKLSIILKTKKDTLALEEERKRKELTVWPTSSKTISSGFGYRILNGEPDYHNGVDILPNSDRDIISCMYGTVMELGYHSSMGNYLRIKSDKYTVTYMHLESWSVDLGQTVYAGDLVGIMGNTGYSFGTHLHFEVWDINGVPIDPTKVF